MEYGSRGFYVVNDHLRLGQEEEKQILHPINLLNSSPLDSGLADLAQGPDAVFLLSTAPGWAELTACLTDA